MRKGLRITLLEHPREVSSVHFNDIANAPICSCMMTGFAAACLKEAGFQVTLVNAINWTFDETKKHLLEAPFDLLAVHAVYFWEKTNLLFDMLTDLKRINHGVPICFFGFFPTLAWQDIMTHFPFIDYVIVGEPEETIVELAHHMERGIDRGLRGLAVRIHDKPVLLGIRDPISSLDGLPYPLRPDIQNAQTICVQASRGCYNGCSFCPIPVLTGGKAAWRGRSVQDVVYEVTGLVHKGYRDIYFVDPNFIGPGKAGKKRAFELARSLSELGITFGMETRADDLTSPLMKALVDAGLTSLLIGLESGSHGVLNRLRKNTSVKENQDSIEMVREAGLEPELGFIMFEPESTVNDIEENFLFLKGNRLLDRLDRTVNILHHQQILFKGTSGYNRALAKGRLISKGFLGFQGEPVYDDYRVAWLSRLVTSICQSVLKEMDNPHSPVYWKRESENRAVFKRVNDRVVRVFSHLLNTSQDLRSDLDPKWSASVLRELTEDIRAVTRKTELNR
ncbi:MAG: radical SAM protein [Thermodesulfobacteriota bacterium]|nr:radical SAM protein [Thermodesulfobacteriota bacterium]